MKVGDLVECIVDDELGRLKAGDRHRVSRVFGSGYSEYIDIGVDPEGWSACRFKVVEEGVVKKKLSEMQPGDRFRTMFFSGYLMVGKCDGGWAVQVSGGAIAAIAVWVDAEYEIVPLAPTPVARPFASGEEFAPHREKWLKWKDESLDQSNRLWVIDYNDRGVMAGDAGKTWGEAFRAYVFEDGSPFGVVDSVCNGSES